MKTIRRHLVLFMLILMLSGITAFPIQTEIDFMYSHITSFPSMFTDWITILYTNINSTPDVMFYGTDWLAFAHIIIALFFVPVYLDPIKHKANLYVGMVACLLIFPLAFICGPIRNIPFFHQLIDCSFGIIGIIYLYFILQRINKLNH
jgi:peptidoglycan/LPS O-acetylase OafA/YrhL